MPWWFEDLSDDILTWDQIYLKTFQISFPSRAHGPQLRSGWLSYDLRNDSLSVYIWTESSTLHLCLQSILKCTSGTKWIIPKIIMQILKRAHLVFNYHGRIHRFHVLITLPSWQQTVLSLSLVGGQIVGSSQHCWSSSNLTCFFITKSRELDMPGCW